MTSRQLQEIKARCDAATPGPWCKDDGEALKVRAPHGGYVTILGNLIGHHGSGGREQPDTVSANADFIAHARTDIPALIAEVRWLRGLVDAYKKLSGCTDIFIFAAEYVAEIKYECVAGHPVPEEMLDALAVAKNAMDFARADVMNFKGDNE